MRRRTLLLGAWLGGLTSLPLIALSYLGRRWAGLPFVPFDVFDWLARVLPGRLLEVGIGSMVRIIAALGLTPIDVVAKRIEHLLGVGITVAGAAALGLLAALIRETSGWSARRVGGSAGAVAFVALAAIEWQLGTSVAEQPGRGLLWLAVLCLGWGSWMAMWLARRGGLPAPATRPGAAAQRRAFLWKMVGGSIGAALALWGLAQFGEGSSAGSEGGSPSAGGAAPAAPPARPPLGAAREGRLSPAPGTRPDITPNPDFYRIDIDSTPPIIDPAAWRLDASGLFDRPRRLSLDELRAYAPVTQPITLCCISNPVGGDLISTAEFTGVPVPELLRDLGIQAGATALLLRSADGYYETVTREDMWDPRTLLVYAMNGVPLPAAHGFPLRIYIPNRYGMKQPKWITSLQAVNHEEPGYWVVRGWSRAARPQILSVIDTVAVADIRDGRVPVGGIAWAGDRGIRAVEVQVDEAPWAEAALLTPPLGPLTWVRWRYDWPAVPGPHRFRVRATDGTGARQTGAVRDAYPDGATGYHILTATIPPPGRTAGA
jgi:DMSO/TMAO reductase YedYZ molybdopterin-dependent catalytic subunit